jgi:hypothetical protein
VALVGGVETLVDQPPRVGPERVQVQQGEIVQDEVGASRLELQPSRRPVDADDQTEAGVPGCAHPGRRRLHHGDARRVDAQPTRRLGEDRLSGTVRRSLVDHHVEPVRRDVRPVGADQCRRQSTGPQPGHEVRRPR